MDRRTKPLKSSVGFAAICWRSDWFQDPLIFMNYIRPCPAISSLSIFMAMIGFRGQIRMSFLRDRHARNPTPGGSRKSRHQVSTGSSFEILITGLQALTIPVSSLQPSGSGTIRYSRIVHRASGLGEWWRRMSAPSTTILRWACNIRDCSICVIIR